MQNLLLYYVDDMPSMTRSRNLKDNVYSGSVMTPGRGGGRAGGRGDVLSRKEGGLERSSGSVRGTTAPGIIADLGRKGSL